MDLNTTKTATDFMNFTILPEINLSTMYTTNSAISQNVRPRGVSKFYPIIITEMVLSIMCLLFTIFVYSVLPGSRSVHGKNLITLSSCLIVAFVFLILDLLLRGHLPFATCYIFALVIHFSFLANFFWTNVVAFDICKSITDLKPKSEGDNDGKYLKYSIYAWTATALTAIAGVVFDRTEWLPIDYRPNFGTRRCWLNGKKGFLLFFNAPVGALLLSNLIMLFITIGSLIKMKKMTDKMHIKQQQQRFYLYLKLMLVVGTIWLTEFLPLATGIYILYALAGIMTSFHGVLLFLTFVCNRRVITQLCQKYNIRCCPTYFLEQKSTTTNNSSSSMTSNGKVSKVGWPQAVEASPSRGCSHPNTIRMPADRQILGSDESFIFSRLLSSQSSESLTNSPSGKPPTVRKAFP